MGDAEGDGRGGEWKREFFLSSSSFRVAAMAALGQPELGDPSKSPMWVQTPKDLGHFPLVSQVRQQGAEWEVEPWELESMPMGYWLCRQPDMLCYNAGSIKKYVYLLIIFTWLFNHQVSFYHRHLFGK